MASSALLYLPEVHAAHDASLMVVPAVKPWPEVHEVVVIAEHSLPFVPALKFVPATQLEHSPSVVGVAGVSPLPAVHEVIVTAAHGLPFVPAL